MWINGMMTQNSFTIYECVLQGRLLGNYVLLENMQGVLSRSQLLYMLRFSHISSTHKIIVYSITWGVSMPLQNGTDLWLCQVPITVNHYDTGFNSIKFKWMCCKCVETPICHFSKILTTLMLSLMLFWKKHNSTAIRK